MKMEMSTIIKLLELSGGAYGEFAPLLREKRLIQTDSLKTGIQCQIRQYQDTLVVAFRGSDSPKDAWTDLQFLRCTAPYGNEQTKIKVHCGFLNAYKNDEVRQRLHGLMAENIHKVKVTGHSLGAALAILCAVDLQYHFPDVDYEVVVFGCPRVGNRAFQRSYDKRIFKTVRVENGNDIITKIPYALWGYRHVGAVLHVGGRRLPFAVSFEQHRVQEYYGKLLERLT